jgi:hypothetical protein
VQPTEHHDFPFGRARAGFYALLGVVLLTAVVLVMLAHQALA